MSNYKKYEWINNTFNYCVDYVKNIYLRYKTKYPNIICPEVKLKNSNEVNACVTEDNHITLNLGLFTELPSAVSKRFSDEMITMNQLQLSIKNDEIRREIYRYALHFLLLHEVYHIFHSHIPWLKKYAFDHNGKLFELSGYGENIITSLEEQAVLYGCTTNQEERQMYLTRQAIEYDADISAIDQLHHDIMTAGASMDKKDMQIYVRENMMLMEAGITTVYSIFNQNAGAKFDDLQDDSLYDSKHPIPALRMYYTDEQLNWLDYEAIQPIDMQFINDIRFARVMAEIDFNSIYGPQDDWNKQPDLPAYTEKAQKHLSVIKTRFNDMYATMDLLALGAMREKLSDEEISIAKIAERFTDDGKML